jgi:hypothetical protein
VNEGRARSPETFSRQVAHSAPSRVTLTPLPAIPAGRSSTTESAVIAVLAEGLVIVSL